MRKVGLALLVATALAAAAPAARAAIPITAATMTPSDTRAGAHPDLTIVTELSQSEHPFTGDDVREIALEFPPGLLGNPRAAPQCALSSFQADNCPAATRVGAVSVNATAWFGWFQADTEAPGSVYNLPAGPGEAARLGVWVRPPFNFEKFSFLTPVHVRPQRDYGLDAALTGLPRDVNGVPIRTNRVELRLDALTSSGAAFMTNPTSCLPATARTRVTSYGDPSNPSSASASFTPTACGELQFATGLSVVPDKDLAEAPAGAEVELTVSGEELPRRHAHVRSTTVDLPAGMSLNPGLAAGLEGCDAQAFLAGGTCPEGADIGDVVLSTPPLGDVAGEIFFATPTSEHPWRSLVLLRLPGADGRLVGDIALDPTDGRIRTAFPGLPQVPFTSLALRFAGGARGVFLTPPGCGTHTANALLEPWTRATSATPADSAPTATFETTYHGGCPAEQPFGPTLGAGFESRDPSLTLRIERPDRHQRITGLTMSLPGSLLNVLGMQAVERCARDVAAAASCGEGSRLGAVTAAVGAGSKPLELTGQLHLTEPAPGELAGVSISLPGRVGPLDLGPVVVPGRVVVDQNAIHVITDAIPQIQGGIPLPLQALELRLDRPETLTSASPCGGASVQAELRGSAGAVARPSATVEFPACVAARRAARPRARLSLRFRHGVGTLRGRVRAGEQGARLRRVRIRLPRGLTDRGRRVLVVRARRGGRRVLRVRARGLTPTAALARSLRARRPPPRLRFRLHVRDVSGAAFRLRVRVRPKLG